VGQHKGIETFTIGQRKGLGIALGEPHFVIKIDVETHDVVLGKKSELGRRELTASETNWLNDPESNESEPFRCQAQIRYNSAAAPATAWREGGSLKVLFDEPQDGVAPGQAVVCYDDNRVLGGGWIDS